MLFKNCKINVYNICSGFGFSEDAINTAADEQISLANENREGAVIKVRIGILSECGE